MNLRIIMLIMLNILLLKKFDNLMAENLATRQANLVNKTDFDNKLKSFI